MRVLILLLCFFIGHSAQAQKKPVKKAPIAAKNTTATTSTINVTVSGYTQGLAYLAYYYGNNIYVQDSAALSPSGACTFKLGSDVLGGIYILALPENKRVDFLFNKEPLITITGNKNTIETGVKITGSAENTEYLKYQKFIQVAGSQREEARQNYNNAKTSADSIKYEKAFKLHNNQMNEYREQVVRNIPKSFLASLFLAMQEPPQIKTLPKSRKDSVEFDYYNRKAFWAGFSFMDDRLIRTPFLVSKLNKYYNEYVLNADSIIKDVDYKLLLARNSPELYKFLLNWYTDFYVTPKYLGQDAVLVHLFNKYHSKGISNWLNEKQLKYISDRAYMLMNNLIGGPAAPVVFMSSQEQLVGLYDVKAKYTLVVFWDPNCGHCKTEVPRIDSFYTKLWKPIGLKVYAVLTPDGADKDVVNTWKKFIADNALTEWTHAYQTPAMRAEEEKTGQPGFRQLFDITSTPTVYLLDAEKRILAKKLTLDQINSFLKLKESGKNNEGF
jgi:thiol-disulfide isomerase/thioredoxin